MRSSEQPFLFDVKNQLDKREENGELMNDGACKMSYDANYKKTVDGHVELLREKGEWNDKHGDKRSRLIFIGVGLDKEGMRRALEGALVTEDETAKLGGVEGWKELDDPL